MADDLVIPALKIALDGLAQRQRVIATNVANISTPGYQAQSVEFESALHVRGLDHAERVHLRPRGHDQRGGTADPSRQDGNNVNLDTETLSDIDTGLRYQLALNAMDSQFPS